MRYSRSYPRVCQPRSDSYREIPSNLIRFESAQSRRLTSKIDTDSAGRSRFLSYVIQFAGWTIYHSGDTVLYDTLAENLKRLEIDVALLPINSRSPDRRVADNVARLWQIEIVLHFGQPLDLISLPR